MTAFARQEQTLESGVLSWEIRSVNHRYLELSLRMDESFRPQEIAIRKLFAQHIARGKVEAVLRFNPAIADGQAIHIDENLAKSVIDACVRLSDLSPATAPLDPLRLLQWPGVVSAQQTDVEALNAAVLSLLKNSLQDFVATRAREGEALAEMLLQRCQEIAEIAVKVRGQMPQILAQNHERMMQRLADFTVELEPERLAQEAALLAQKSDVAEELDRLENHVNEVRHILGRKEPVGRRLDFLMQELNREANTLASKSIDTDTTRYAVDLKVLIEQMREQIQNIE
ncbi:YicC/YloC family endoribonuclease [Methylophaga sp. OBS3]|uniref:YicC/YloC family endoribonuclease n=1 Tax=Methylophaga sp. OBS3 TaxID=2991934 RepID=UPI002253148D|nr:YicC/YloC family endoribonuclease [Methylophaga sp. OBS3]MCX4190659.1 YicC family protein [Methylophaga sp. OBS3]